MAPLLSRLGLGGGHGFGFGRRGVAEPSYSVSPSTASVNEGSSVTFTVTTAHVPDATTLYWSLNTVSGTINTSDFSGAAVSGSFTITGNTGSVILTLANDVTTEGSESFQLQVRTGSTSGTIVATSSTVTIGDTSLNPVPPTLVSYIIVGGGGSGGTDPRGGGGGGAGGAITGTVPVSPGSSYTITIGGGGSPTTAFGLEAYAGGPGQGVPGQPSNASGGGGNADSPNSDYFKGGYGGPQGNPGGSGNHGHYNPYQGGGGGGGGAGGAGSSNPHPDAADGSSRGAPGGSGVNRSIAGFSGNFAAGGGGGSDSSGPGDGGSGGGGYGGFGPDSYAGAYFPGANGEVNTGSGGGGNGGNGGSGKVVISYPDTYAIATSTTGTSSPGEGVSGNRVYIWNGTGSITF